MVNFSDIEKELSFAVSVSELIDSKLNGTYAQLLGSVLEKSPEAKNWQEFVAKEGDEKITKMLKEMQKEEIRYQQWKEKKHENDIKRDDSYNGIEYKGLEPNGDMQLYFASKNFEKEEAQTHFMRKVKLVDGNPRFIDKDFEKWNTTRKTKEDENDRKTFKKECDKYINSYIEKTEGKKRTVSDEEYSSLLSAAIDNNKKQAEEVKPKGPRPTGARPVAKPREGEEKMADDKFVVNAEDRATLEAYFAAQKITGIDLDNIDKADFDKHMTAAKAAEGAEEDTLSAPEAGKEGNEGQPSIEGDDKVDEIGLDPKDGIKREPDPQWIQDMESHWKGWCEEENRNYIYERDPEQKEGLAFKYYKDAAAKETGEYSAEVHYQTPESVRISTKDGKPADYDFWNNFAKAAQKNNQVVNFAKMAKPENMAKLHIACILNGVDVKNVNEEAMDYTKAFEQLSPEEKKVAMEKLNLDENGNKIKEEKAAEEKNASEGENKEDKEKETTPPVAGKDDIQDDKPAEFTLKELKILELYATKSGKPLGETSEALNFAKKMVLEKDGSDDDIKTAFSGVDKDNKDVSGYETAKSKCDSIDKKLQLVAANMPEGVDKLSVSAYKQIHSETVAKATKEKTKGGAEK